VVPGQTGFAPECMYKNHTTNNRLTSEEPDEV
jgi:hypothetical protein